MSVTGPSTVNITATADEAVTMAHGRRPITVEHAVIDANTSGNTTIAALRAGKKFIILAYNYMSNGAVNVHWRSASTPITGPSYLVEAGRGKVCPYNPKGWCKTASGEALVLNLSAAIAVGGEVTFIAIEEA
jgi:hypothetical protein